MSERPSLTHQLHQAWLHTKKVKALKNSAPTNKSQPVAESHSASVSGTSESLSAAENLLSSPSGDEANYAAAPTLPSRQQGHDPTLAYFAQVLNDQAPDAETYMTTDLVAYQVIHNDLAELLGHARPSQDFAAGVSPIEAQAPVDGWVSSLLRTPRPELGEGQAAWTSQAQAYQIERKPSGEVLRSAGPSRSADTAFAKAPAPDTLSQLAVLLVECAQAVLGNDGDANGLIRAVRAVSSSYGSGLQRTAHYFAEGLEARLCGTGATVYTAIKKDRTSTLDNLKAYQYIMTKCPYHKSAHRHANSVLLASCEGAQQVHIIDYGIDGFQWPSFMQALANRPGGPPRLRITGIDFPQPGRNPDKRVTETGRRLGRFAASLGIPFEYKGFADRWENVQISSLGLQPDEVVAVSVMFRLRHLLDDTVIPSNPRMAILQRIRSMNPRILVTGVISAALNTPSFISRFREAIPHYYAYFDSLDCTIPRDNVDRLMVEAEILGREVLNVVACEGMDRMERHETHLQWQQRLIYSGFQQIPIDQRNFQSACEIFSEFHRDWGVGHDNGWLVMGWKDRTQLALAAWQPAL